MRSLRIRHAQPDRPCARSQRHPRPPRAPAQWPAVRPLAYRRRHAVPPLAAGHPGADKLISVRIAFTITLPAALPTSLTELVKGSTVNIAVTGLTRAGKTVFFTSLIHNLLSAIYDPELMPLLGVASERRLVSAKIAGAKASRLPRFPYQRNIEKMPASPPVWPQGTTDISEIEIDIRFLPAGTLGKLLGRVSSEAATLRIRIVDYPGEWL